MAKYTAESERLWLQPFSVEHHLEDYHEMVSDPRVMVWASRPESKSIEESETWLRSRIPPSENPLMENYAILLKPHTPSGGAAETSKPKMIGGVGTPRSTPVAIEVGYWLHPDYWGKGYLTEALRLFIDLYWAPEREGSMDTITAEIDTGNLASEKVVTKLGFTTGEGLEEVDQLGPEIRNKAGTTGKTRVWYLARQR